MPIAPFTAVREVSSEDPVHVAENLLKDNAGKKWKTETCGDESAYVILEFNEPQQITGIDIGNEQSALVEVLVSQKGCGSKDFKELLLPSAFMTPIEARNSNNTNRVRCFSVDALSSKLQGEKWKFVKVVCTQPYNKHVQYGLSFIKVHVADMTTGEETTQKPLVPEKYLKFQPTKAVKEALISTIGNVRLREESPDSESEDKAALFQRWKASRSETAPTAAAAIRDASQPSALHKLSNTIRPSVLLTRSTSASPKVEAKRLDCNRKSLVFGSDSDDEVDLKNNFKMQRISKHLEADKQRREVEMEKQKQKETSKRHSIDDKPSTPTQKSEQSATSSIEKKKPIERAQKRLSSVDDTSSENKSAKKQKISPNVQYRPFNELLHGVVLVISGIQNPDRADLRSKALALGAKYMTDWQTGCTHLICAFKNTPKYNQVKGKGKIVTRSWIEKCYALKKYLPWRRYALDTADVNQAESDEEIVDESLRSNIDLNKANTNLVDDNSNNSDDVAGRLIQSASDTDDELERVAQATSQKENLAAAQNVFEVSTDEEDYLAEKKNQLYPK